MKKARCALGGRVSWIFAAIGIVAVPAPCLAQRVNDNAVAQAEDAYGTIAGDEEVGIYGPGEVRGFSPTEAGNIRIEGLAFDQLWPLAIQLRQSTAIKVGLAARSFPFIAPTGVVDYRLRRPGKQVRFEAFVRADSLGGRSLEVLADLPVASRLGFVTSFAASDTVFGNATSSTQLQGTVLTRWQPTAEVEIVAFAGGGIDRDDEVGPIYITPIGQRPPRLPRSEFRGPAWADFEADFLNAGALASYRPNDRSTLSAGVFLSNVDVAARFANLAFIDNDEPTRTRRLVLQDPPLNDRVLSGEMRYSHQFEIGRTRHTLTAAARFRDRTNFFGGTLVRADETIGIDDVLASPPRPGVFGRLTRDDVDEIGVGASYAGSFAEVAEFDASLLRTRVTKSFKVPDEEPTLTERSLWLPGFSLVLKPDRRVALYAGFVKGIEQAPIAPSVAVNRATLPPPIATEQWDAGAQFRISPRLTAIAGIFELTKPYFNLNDLGVFRELGSVRHKGIEFSLTGALSPKVTIVAGAVLIDPVVTASTGNIGRRPVNEPKLRVAISGEWRPWQDRNLAFTGGINHVSERAADVPNEAFIDSLTTFSLGARYGFKLGASDMLLRLQIDNLTNSYAPRLRGASAFDVEEPRVVALSLALRT
jgi:iron complex outermembrane receptor protein